jgi:hypothetical protein
VSEGARPPRTAISIPSAARSTVRSSSRSSRRKPGCVASNAGSFGTIRTTPSVTDAETTSLPATANSGRTLARASSASDRSRVACWRNSRPSSVRRRLRVVRTRSFAPSSASSAAIWRLMADNETRSDRAARESEPASATCTKVPARRRKSMPGKIAWPHSPRQPLGQGHCSSRSSIGAAEFVHVVLISPPSMT